MNTLDGVSGVYALVDPRTEETVYVGQSRDVGRRLDQHLNPMIDDGNWKKQEWIVELLNLGLVPSMRLLLRSDDPDAKDREEIRAIHEFRERGECRCNQASGGRGAPISHVAASDRAEWKELGRQLREIKMLLGRSARLAGKLSGASGHDLILKSVYRLEKTAAQLDEKLTAKYPSWDDFFTAFNGPFP
jgi:hypothetical protein